MEFGQKLAMLRSEKELYQKELASYLNLSVGTISNYEKGIHYPDLNTLCRLADYFDVTTDYLLGRTSHRHAPETLDLPLTSSYTVADLINTTLELSPQDLTHMLDYIKYLENRNH